MCAGMQRGRVWSNSVPIVVWVSLICSLGRTAGACVRDRLALEAKRLLLHTDMTAAEVADRLGFGDPAYFARFFRREAGSPPSAYRARNPASARDIMRGE